MSSSSDRSSTSTPLSESESIASNSTIISDQATQPSTPQTHQNSQPTSRHGAGRSGNVSRTDASNSICSPALTSNSNGSNNGAFTVRLEHHGGNRWSSSVSGSSSLTGRKNHHNNNNNNHQYDSISRQEQANESSGNNKDQNYNNSNQRITRSSQRAAQQVKTDLNQSDSNNGDDQQQLESEKDSGRKVKRRKGDTLQDIDQDSSQAPIVPQPPAMANICPADYQLPTQNSFQLYREIRNFSSQRLGKLHHVQPKTPHGFKEYLLNSCLYTLDDSWTSVKSGESSDPIIEKSPANFKKTRTSGSITAKLTSIKSEHSANSKEPTILYRNNSTKVSSPPANLEKDSSLFELFQEHENARQQMQIQHLKERERLILSAEQEVLRAYNRAAIAGKGQEHPLSACTYLYYQEKYHYSDNISDKKRQIKQERNQDQQKEEQSIKEANSEDNKDLSPADANETNAAQNIDKINPTTTNKSVTTTTISIISPESSIIGDSVKTGMSIEMSDKSGVNITPKQTKKEEPVEQEQAKLDESSCDDNLTISENDTNDNTGKLLINELTLSDVDSNVVIKIESNSDKGCQAAKSDVETFKSHVNNDNGDTNSTSMAIQDEKGKQASAHDVAITSNANNNNEDENKNDETIIEDRISDEELKILNKDIFLKQLQEIDEKWEKIRNDMLVRHRNEADSLFAVQSMEWEWKTKELGLCDVRKPFKLEPEFVPRIEIVSHDY